MPELPEVEVVKRGLEDFFKNQPILIRMEFLRKNLRDPMPIKKLKTLEGSKILGVYRRAKYLIIETDKGKMISHLGMTGSWRKKSEPFLHDHIYLHFSNGQTLAYSDPRRFGIFDFLDDSTEEKRLSHLGPEPLDENLSADAFWQRLKVKNSALKVAIMDQKVIVGVGNIYASEALFLAKIKPTVKAKKISALKSKNLLRAIQQILSSAISAGGSTISNFKSTNGQSGYFQDQHFVYGRSGQACRVCKSTIRSSVIAGRSTFWCAKCQS